MLALSLVLVLGAADVPVADRPAVLTPFEPAHLAALYAPDRPLSFQTTVYPTMPVSRFFLNIGSTLARPFRPELTDAWIIAPTFLLGAIALNTDVESHHLAKKLPDPKMGNHALSYWVSFLGEGWVDVTIFLTLALVGGRDGQRACLAGIQALVATAIASRVGKLVFQLERPSYDSERQHWWSRPSADAMPSGHAMAAFATAAVLSREYPRFGPIFFILATWVGVARVQQDTHWLSDVLVGAALGTLFGWQSWKLTREYEVEVQPWAGTTSAGLSVAKRF